jgi:PiT family inorganic phosphate transporter
MDHFTVFLILAVVLCLLMTWGVGANDLANVMSTTMGSKAVTAKQGILIAIIFEFLGAFFGGTGVTETMRDGIINTSALLDKPEILMVKNEATGNVVEIDTENKMKFNN